MHARNSSYYALRSRLARKTVYSIPFTYLASCFKLASLGLRWHMNLYFPPKVFPLQLPYITLHAFSPLLFKNYSSKSFQQLSIWNLPETQNTTYYERMAFIVNNPKDLLSLSEIPTLKWGYLPEVTFWLRHIWGGPNIPDKTC